MFAYCGNNPIRYTDTYGTRYEEYAGGGGCGVGSGVGISIGCGGGGGGSFAIDTSYFGYVGVDYGYGVGTSTGDVEIGYVVLPIVDWIAGDDGNYVSSKSKQKYDPDPYARPNQKKQNRETKNKNRRKENFEPRNNRRDGKPAPPKHHTPGRDHRKHSQPIKTKMDMLYKQIG